MSAELVTLVDADDNAIGCEEKLRVHIEGKLHRAFSAFVFDRSGRLLLQRRAASKYHSAGLWSNTCCGHPRPGEPVPQSGRRRLFEEMGFRCDLREIFHFVYRAALDRQLFEHEVDHVLVGRFEGVVAPEQCEVDSWIWMPMTHLLHAIDRRPEHFTFWLRVIMSNDAHRRALEQASRP